MWTEKLRNVLGDDVEIFVRPPSDDAQNYTLNTKYLTKDCSKCRACIPEKEAIELVLKIAGEITKKWTQPNIESIEGICIWGEYPKILVERTKGARHCDFFGKKRGRTRRDLLPEIISE